VLQVQTGAGPCVECIDSRHPVVATGSDALVERWGDVGRAIVVAGFDAVAAYPMRWRGRVLGGLNIFRSTLDSENAPEDVAQAFADAATLVLIQSSEVPDDQITARVQDAVSARIQIEQAKGVLAHLRGIELADAYIVLKDMAAESAQSLTQTARHVVREQHA
jgi:ANTAR domain